MVVYSKAEVHSNPLDGDKIIIEKVDVFSDEHMFLDNIDTSISRGWVKKIQGILVAQDDFSIREIRVGTKRFFRLRENVDIPLSKLVNGEFFFKGESLNQFPFEVAKGACKAILIEGIILSDENETSFKYLSQLGVVSQAFTTTNKPYNVVILNVAYTREGLGFEGATLKLK